MKDEVKIPVELLDEMITYIEETEETIDSEWGASRSKDELIEQNLMPDLYNKLKELQRSVMEARQLSHP